MDYRAMFRGDFIKAVEFEGREPTMTITGVKLVKIQQEDGTEKTRGAVLFKETDRGFVLNRTNAECLAMLFGKDTDAWSGKRITLYSTDVKYGGRNELGIRVRGSPDITEEVNCTVKLPRKKPFVMKLVPTGKSGREPVST